MSELAGCIHTLFLVFAFLLVSIHMCLPIHLASYGSFIHPFVLHVLMPPIVFLKTSLIMADLYLCYVVSPRLGGSLTLHYMARLTP